MKAVNIAQDTEKGEIFLDGNSFLLISRGNIASLQRDFERVMGPVATSIVYNSGREYAQKVQSHLKKNSAGIPAKEIAGKMLDFFSSCGYGKAEFIDFNESGQFAKLKVTNSANTIGYKNSQKPVCHFVRGIIAGSGTIIFGREMHCLETRCVAKGDPYCEFEVLTKEETEKRKLGGM